MRKLLLLVVAVSLIYGFVYEKSISIPLNISLSSQSSDSSLQNAYKNRQSDLQVQGE
jgi:hypothetical protein